MNIDDLTIREAREIAAMFNAQLPRASSATTAYHRWLGRNIIVRCVTNHFTGRLVEITDGELVLEGAAWIADSGRWSEALESGTLGEVEPYPDDAPVVVAKGGVIDATLWPFALPRAVK